MTKQTNRHTGHSASGIELVPLGESWVRSCRAANLSASTAESYAGAIKSLAAHLDTQGMPLVVEHLTREHIETYLAGLLSGRTPLHGRGRGAPYKPGTVLTRYRALKNFFRWLVEIGELQRSPMEKMRPPRISQEPPAMLSEDQLRDVLRTCEGKGFFERRDLALILLLYDTGMRVSECAGLEMADIDWKARPAPTARVLGKGNKVRYVPIGSAAAAALDMYVTLARARHTQAHAAALWLGKTGALTSDGIYKAVRSRGARAGIKGLHPHMFRHTHAHAWLLAGGQEGDLMENCGWSSPAMLTRYGRAGRAQRAREAHKRLSPADQLVYDNRKGRRDK